MVQSIKIFCYLTYQFIYHMIYVIEGIGALINEKGEEQPLKAGDFALVNPDEKRQYRNKGDIPFKMICGVPKEFESLSFRIIYFTRLSKTLRGIINYQDPVIVTS